MTRFVSSVVCGRKRGTSFAWGTAGKALADGPSWAERQRLEIARPRHSLGRLGRSVGLKGEEGGRVIGKRKEEKERRGRGTRHQSCDLGSTLSCSPRNAAAGGQPEGEKGRNAAWEEHSRLPLGWLVTGARGRDGD